MDNQVQPTTTTTLPALTTIQTVAELITKNLPRMQKGSANAVLAMQAITQITDEEEYEHANETLVAVATTYDKIQQMRKQMTEPFDELKKELMLSERPLSDDKGSEAQRVRLMMAAYKQSKIDEKNRIAKEAEEKRLRENHIVDIKTWIMKQLSDMLTAKAAKAESWSKDFWSKVTLADFDKQADYFNKVGTKLNIADYEACFKSQYNKNILDEDQYLLVVNELKTVEPYDKWATAAEKVITPVINAWRAKIPDLKKNLEELAKASAEQAQKLKKEQEARAEKEAADRQQQLKDEADLRAKDIEAQANVEKMSNSFAAQATVQQVEDAGPKKYIVKFTDPARTMEAMMNVVCHCMGHKDFPGIQRRDKNKKLVVDEQGRPEYIEPVQWWLNFFAQKCDIEVPGLEYIELPKIILKSK